MIRIKKILCPVDFSPPSLRAFDHAVKLATSFGAGVHALHVVSPIVQSAYDYPLNISEYNETLRRNSMRELDKLGRKTERTPVPFRAEVMLGSVDNEIHKAIKRSRADFVVMGTHGRRGFERWILGSEADRLLRSCPVPLLTIGSVKGARTPSRAIRRILVTTDFSKETSEALKYAFEFGQESRARITLLHVVDQIGIDPQTKLLPPTIDAIRRQLEKIVPADARRLCEVKTRIEVGVPYTTILTVQESEKTDLLILNVHGKGFLDRALLGSTAERVVRGAVCPVLTIPPAPAPKARARLKKTRK